MSLTEQVKQFAEQSGISQSLSDRIIQLTTILEKITEEKYGKEFVEKLGALPALSRKALDDDDSQAACENQRPGIIRYCAAYFLMSNQ